MKAVIKEDGRVQKPKWIRVKLPTGQNYRKLRGLVDKYELNTICESGSSRNMRVLWSAGTATYMIVRNMCSRSCEFCRVKTGRHEQEDEEQPEKVAKSIKQMQIKLAVLTILDRDHL